MKNRYWLTGIIRGLLVSLLIVLGHFIYMFFQPTGFYNSLVNNLIFGVFIIWIYLVAAGIVLGGIIGFIVGLVKNNKK